MSQFYRSRNHNPSGILFEEPSSQSSSLSSSYSSITFTNHNGNKPILQRVKQSLQPSNQDDSATVACMKLYSNPCSTISKHATSEISATGYSPLLDDARNSNGQQQKSQPTQLSPVLSGSCSFLKEEQSGIISHNIAPKQQDEPAVIQVSIESKPATNQEMTKYQTSSSVINEVRKKCNPFSEYVSNQRAVIETKLMGLSTQASTAATSTCVLTKQERIVPSVQQICQLSTHLLPRTSTGQSIIVRPFYQKDPSQAKAAPKVRYVPSVSLCQLALEQQQGMQERKIKKQPIRVIKDISQECKVLMNRPIAKISAFSLNDSDSHERVDTSSTLGSPIAVKSAKSPIALTYSRANNHSLSSTASVNEKVPPIYLFSNPCVSPKMVAKEGVIGKQQESKLYFSNETLSNAVTSNLLAKQQQCSVINIDDLDEKMADQRIEKHAQTQKKCKGNDNNASIVLTRTNSIIKTSAQIEYQKEEQNKEPFLKRTNKQLQQTQQQSLTVNNPNAIIARKHLEAIDEKHRQIIKSQLSNLATGGRRQLVKSQNYFPTIPAPTTSQAPVAAAMASTYVSAIDKPDFGRIVNRLYKNFGAAPKKSMKSK